MLSASFRASSHWIPNKELFWGQMDNGQTILYKFILTSSKFFIFRGLRPSESLNKGFNCTGSHWGELPDRFTGSPYHACLLIFLQVVLNLLDHLDLPLQSYLHHWGKTSIGISHFTIFFIQCILMSGIICLSMFPLLRRCQFSEGNHHLFLHAHPWFTTPTIKVGIYHNIMSST